MLGKLFDTLFGCWHRHYSFPITVRKGSRRNAAAAITGTYVVCLDCGKEFPYDWHEMKMIDSASEGSGRVGSLATKEAA
ncbi:MAG: hypothetical protein DMG88_11125 [Acidobacteria bacterium]|nr:MAG: hypothetical protein DMG88_11125 [Acidobacteriota bacterium]